MSAWNQGLTIEEDFKITKRHKKKQFLNKNNSKSLILPRFTQSYPNMFNQKWFISSRSFQNIK
jgi:hypothetical protein